VWCLAVVLASGLSGCRPRVAADHNTPAVSPSASMGQQGSTAQQGSINQQDVDNLNGILASAGGAVTSVRSAISADGPTPKG
jgi:hypothetical protein